MNFTQCENSTDCRFIDNAQCDNTTGRCACLPGFTPEPPAGSGASASAGTSCRRAVLGDPCRPHLQDCSTFLSYAVCDSSTLTCTCAAGYKVETVTSYNATTNTSSSSEECRERQLGDPCSDSIDCEAVIPNSRCLLQVQTPASGNQSSNSTASPEGGATVTYVCACDKGHAPVSSNSSCECLYMHKGRCLPVKIDHTTCSKHSDCNEVSHSSCTNGVCACEEGYGSAEEGSQCEKLVLGSACEEDSDCTSRLQNTACVESACACADGYRSNANGRACVKCECACVW